MFLDDDKVHHWATVVHEPGDFPAVTGSAFQFSMVQPEPQVLKDLDTFDFAAYHLLYGDKARARSMLAAINEPWPFEGPVPSGTDLARLTRDDPDWAAAATKVAKALQTTGHTQVADWRESQWGARKEPENAVLYVEGEGSLSIRFSSPDNFLRAFLNWTQRFPKAHIQAIVVDPLTLKQHRLDSRKRSTQGVVLLDTMSAETYDDLMEHCWLPN